MISPPPTTDQATVTRLTKAMLACNPGLGEELAATMSAEILDPKESQDDARWESVTIPPTPEGAFAAIKALGDSDYYGGFSRMNTLEVSEILGVALPRALSILKRAQKRGLVSQSTQRVAPPAGGVWGRGQMYGGGRKRIGYAVWQIYYTRRAST